MIDQKEPEKLHRNGYLPYPVASKHPNQKQRKAPDFKKGEKTGFIEAVKNGGIPPKKFHGIGVFPYAGLNAIDYDLTPGALVKKGFDETTAAEIVSRIQPLADDILQQAIVARTGSKGYAAFFRGVEGKKTSITINAPNGDAVTVIDWMKGTSVGVVIPPTIHPDTRKPYRWLTERTLYDTPLDEHPATPTDLLDQIQTIADQYSVIKPHERKAGASNGVSYVKQGGRVEIPLNTLVELHNGKVVTFAEALANHQGEYCGDPIRPDTDKQRAKVNADCIYSFKTGDRYTPGIPRLYDPEVYKQFKNTKGQKDKIKAANESDTPAQWAYLVCNQFYGRMGLDLPTPNEFIRNNFKLRERDCVELIELTNLKNNHLKVQSIEALSLTTIHQTLKRDENDFLAWVELENLLDHNKLLAVSAEHGSGKTSILLKLLIKKYTELLGGFLVLAHRVTLINQLANLLNMDHYKDRVKVHGSLASTLHSIEKVTDIPHTVFIDEAGQQRRELLTSTIIEDKAATYAKLREILLQAKRVVLLDADLSSEDVAFYEQLCGAKAFVVDAENSSKRFTTKINYSYKPAELNLDAVVNHPEKEKCCVAVEHEKIARSVAQQLRDKGRRVLLVTGGPDSDITGHADINEMLSSENLTNIDVVVYNSKMGTGVSVEDTRFTKCYALLTGTVLTAADAVQLLRRFRAVSDFDIHVSVMGFRDCYRKHRPGNTFKDWQARAKDEQVAGRAFFAVAITELLKRRGFKLTQAIDAGVNIPTKPINQQDAANIPKADYITELHTQLSSDQKVFNKQTYENWALLTRRAYGEITPETVELFCKRPWAAWNIIQLKAGEGIWLHINGVIEQLSKDRVSKAECIDALNALREHYHELRMVDALPSEWLQRGIPSDQRPLGAVRLLLEHYGFKAVCKDSSVVVESCTWTTVKQTKADLKVENARLMAEGKSVRARAKALGVSVGCISNWSKNECSKTPSYPQEHNTLIEDNPVKVNTQKTTNNNELELIESDLEEQPELKEITIGELLANPDITPKEIGKTYNIVSKKAGGVFGTLKPPVFNFGIPSIGSTYKKQPSLGRQLFGREARKKAGIEELARVLAGID